MAAKRGSTDEVQSVRYPTFREEPARVSPAGGSRTAVVILIDRDQKLVSATPAALELFDCPIEECVGRPLAWFLHPGDRDAIARRVSDITSEPGACFTATVRARASGGLWRPVELNAQRVAEFAGAIALTFQELTGASGAAARAAEETRTPLETLQRLNQQLEGEAERVGAILDDELGQLLTSAHITLADVCEAASPELRERLLAVRGHLERLEQRLREISDDMHPRIVEDLGLEDAVTSLVESFSRRTGIAVTIESLLHGRYAASAEALVYRFVQEALTNVSRHSRAANAVVRLNGGLQTIVCAVRDDGIGFNAAAFGGDATCSPGLHVMRDRLESVGGTLEIVSAPGGGTEVRATVPVGA